MDDNFITDFLNKAPTKAEQIEQGRIDALSPAAKAIEAKEAYSSAADESYASVTKALATGNSEPVVTLEKLNKKQLTAVFAYVRDTPDNTLIVLQSGSDTQTGALTIDGKNYNWSIYPNAKNFYSATGLQSALIGRLVLHCSDGSVLMLNQSAVGE